METSTERKRRLFRGQMIRELFITSLIGIVFCGLLSIAKDLSILETILYFMSGMTFTIWCNWIYKCAAYCPINIEFQKEDIRMTVIKFFKESEIILSPDEISIINYPFETKEKSCILIYTKPKKRGGYRMRNPVWSYKEQIIILEQFSKYKDITIETLPVYL